MSKIKNFLRRHQKYVKAVEILTIIAVVYAVVYLSFRDSFLIRYLTLLKDQGLKGQLIFVLYWASTIVFTPLPATPLKPVSLIAWGFWPSYLLVLIGDMIGGIVAFAIARRYGHQLTKRFLGKDRHARINKIIGIKNFSSVFKLRFFTNFTYDYVSYAYGLTNIKFSTYFYTTLLSKIIWTYIALFAIDRAIYAQGSPLGIVSVAIYVIGLFVLGVEWINRAAKTK